MEGEMTDQCKNCLYYEDLDQCKATECDKHDDWYAKQLQAEVKCLRVAITEFCAKQEFAVEAWRAQPHIKKLFDICREAE